ncbi:hypothetical protein [Undibacterium sp.]|uniref:hypothetical protein n=1 Tax=Undibacterium sp. TaxID=1914977 RepID=UPI003751C0BF
MHEITLLQAITLAVAAVGAVLGIINTWRAIDNDRVKLLITPVWRIHDVGDDYIVARVINRSSFDVTIVDVGFNFWFSGKHAQAFPGGGFGKSLPYKLEARTSAIFYLIASTSVDKRIWRISGVYVHTDCGLKFNRTNAVLRGFVREKTFARWRT